MAAKRLAEKLSVFVAGPLIEKNWSPEELATQPAATRLRLIIKDHIEEQLQHAVVFGEHRGVNEIGAEHFGTQSSAAIVEIALIDECEAVIIIPASVGSYCELGTWSTREDICRKLLIIVDEQFKNDLSYIRLGTLGMAENHGATVIWHALDEHEHIIDAVDAFVRRAHDKVMVRSVGRGK